jgi:hypothetical protein
LREGSNGRYGDTKPAGMEAAENTFEMVHAGDRVELF